MRSSYLGIFPTALIFILNVYHTDGSHFRGGLITWRPVRKNQSSTKIEVEFSFRFGWRRSSGSHTRCDKLDIESGKLIGEHGFLKCFQGCSGSIGSPQVRCTDFSAIEDWSVGERSLVSSFTSAGPFYIGYKGYAWISNLRKGGGSWRLMTLVNLTVRSDTGLVNSSPLTATAPIITLQQGCNHTIKIPVTDEDGDNIRCRWAKNSEECAGVCFGFVGATLDEHSCTMIFPSSGQQGWYAVAVVIEDFSSRFSTEPLSSVPLQFLVNVYTASGECGGNPEFVGVTRVDGSCVGVPFNSTFSEPIIAYSGGNTFKVTEIQTISPQGFTKSDLAQWDAASNTWYVNVSYTPAKKDPGPEVFCYTAFSSKGSSSPQTCITLLVGVPPPAIVEGSNYPVGNILPNHTSWRLTYNMEFVRPTRSNLIRFINSKGIEVLKIDASFSPHVSFPRDGDVLQFTTSFSFEEKETYSVLMDPGVVKGVVFCGAESEAIRDPTFWKVRIKDITPPKLTFTVAPAVTREVANVSWTFNEEVSVQKCTLQTSTFEFSIQACNNSWTGIKLKEGVHTLYIEAIDLEGNIGAISRHSWKVDLTPPSVQITSAPDPVASIQEFTFSFRCNEQCSLECSVTNQSVSPSKYLNCNSGTFKTHNLNDGEKYTFHVVATDTAGNRARVKTYSWEIDRTPPVIEQLGNHSIDCGNNFDPSVTGYPTFTDNRDPSPTLTYEDEPASGCLVKRNWVLVDEAGNKVGMVQFIVFISKRPPQIIFKADIIIPCGSTSKINSDAQEFRQMIKIVHPCNRTVNVTFRDSDVVNRCGFTFSRTWMVFDDCGEKTTAIQRIKILPLQLPESPQVNELNVDLKKALRWPQYPGAQSYQVYVWYYGQPKPGTPVAVENYRRYVPDKAYQPGSRILWQIQYVIGPNQLLPSPVWSFKTTSFPDLAVIGVTIPSYVFSGDTFEVSWRVQNIGNISTGGTLWYDAVYISKFPSRVQESSIGRKLQRNFLDPGDWYSSKIPVSLKQNDLGNRYIFVETNVYRHVNEINNFNNVGTSSGPLSVRLTPPPDLQVLELITPKSTFSGVSISITWAVKNVGVGATRGNTWYDTAFWCTNNSLSDCNVKLVTVKRSGGLLPGALYNVTASIFVPYAIYGNFFILVITDGGNNIYEHANEDNNVFGSKSSIQVTLTPPPDLVVDEIELPNGRTYSTFDVIKLTYTVINKGSTAPFEPYWYDEVVIVSTKTSQKFVLGRFAISMRLNPGDMYSRTSSFTIPASFENDAYNIMVRTDYKENVFEFNAESNNNRSTEVTISQLLPDLVVDTLSVLLNEGTEHVQLFVNWTISNIGAASTLNFQWADRLYLQNVDVSTPFILGERTVHLSLKSAKNYSVVGQSFSLPNHIFGKMNLMLLTDAIGQLDEESDNNNNYSLLIDIPMLVPDLMPSSLTLLNNGEIYPNSLIKLQWKVKNVGRGKVEEKCEDSIYLLSSPIYGSKVWLGKIERFLVLKSNEEYNVSAEVKIPQNAYAGVHYIEVRVNSPVIVYEAGQSNNNAIKINILIRYPPTADLIITSVTYTSHDIGNVDRFLALLWSGKNIGNSMQNKNTWKDQVKIFAKNVDPEISADGYTLGMFTVSASLRTNQQYSVYKIIPIPSFIEGEISVQVVSDYENSVEEIDGEGNNVYQMKKKINVGIPKRGKLIVKVLKDIPKKASYFASLPVFFNVRNVGEYVTSVSSWIDALYLHVYSSDTVDNIVARGIRLSAILHNGELEVGGEYYVNTTTTVPAISPMEYYVHFIVDSNDVLGSSERTSSSNRTLTVSVGPLPDLTVNPIESKETAEQGGSPYEVRFNVTNTGMAHTNVAWYDGIYLSEDATLDPFDWHLGVTERPLDLQSNESYIQITNVFLPFDLPSRDYYLIFKADTTDKVLETNNGNNQAYQLIKILEAPSADIFVRHVQATPVATLNSDMTFRWNLGNNGSLAASGYRCDATYFSRDDEIDFDDYELGEVTCNTFSINPSGNDTSNDITETKRVKVPLVEEGTFKTIVRTRSNVRDINPVNNVGVSINATFVNITKLAVDGASFEITLKSMEKKIFRLPEVFPEETLVVTLKSDTMTDINRLYLRGKRPPSTSEFDAMSAGELSADKIVVIPVTKVQDYYCLVQNVGSLSANVSNPSKVQLIAKYAKFEVTSVFPQRAAPIGKTTLQIIGTLFPEYVNVSLFNKQNSSDVLKPIEVYRFSSTEIYATFELDGLDVGTMFDIRLTDRRSDSNKASYSPSDGALRLFPGIPGKLSFSVKTSEALRPGEKGFVTVHTYNRGDTDAPLKMMLLSIDKVKGRLVSRNLKTEYSSDILFVPVSSYGPGGILPPKGYADITFEVESNQNTRSSGLQISTMGTSEDKEHIFVEAKELLKPIYYTDEQWEPVWKNFISSVGKTEESLVKKLNAVSSYLSSLGRKISSVTGMIKFLIDVADGTFLTGSQPYIVDDVDTNETLAHGYSVLLRRKYSFSLGSRNSFGVLGRGWILPWWDTSVNRITQSYIFLEWERQQYIFEVISSEGVYYNAVLGELYLNQTSNSLVLVQNDAGLEYHYNVTSNLLVSIKRTADNAEITVSHNQATSLPERFTTSLGDSMTVKYDSVGKLRSTYTFIADHAILSNYDYDEDRSLLTSVTVNGKKTMYRYDEDGFLSEVRFPDNNSIRYKYDNKKLLESSSSFASSGTWIRTLLYKRDENGEVKVFEQPLDVVTTYKYDDRNHLALVGLGLDTPFKMREDGFSRYVLHGDEAISQETLKADGRHLTRKNTKGDAIKVSYDDLGKVSEYDFGDGAVYRANFNSHGKLTEVIYPDLSTEKYEYDENSTLSKSITRNGDIKNYYFDNSGNLIRKEVGKSEKTFSYDEEGRMVSATNEVGTILFGYTSSGIPNYVQYPNNVSLQYTYDLKGRRSSLSYNGKYNISYRYDEVFGRLSEVFQNSDKMLMQVTYDQYGRVSRRTLGNGMYTIFEYDSLAVNLLKLTNYNSNDTVSSRFEYSYDSRGRRISMNTTDGVWYYGYDSLSQLSFIKDPWGNVTRYTYDSRGNRLMAAKNNKRSYYSVNSLNQYISHGDQTFSYDKNGNLINKYDPARATQVFEYDADNRLVSTKQGQKGCNYVYNALGNLFQKTCKDGTSTSFIVDPFGIWGGDVVGKIVNGNEVIFVHGLDHGLIAQLQLQTKEAMFYQFDPQGSVVSLTNSYGELLNSYSYEAFGSVTRKTEKVINDFLFIGQWGAISSEEVPNLCYMRARFYDAEEGRFMSIDPISFRGRSHNLYVYANNNPKSFVDPKGTIVPILVPGFIGAVVNAAVYGITETFFGNGPTKAGLAGSIVTGALGGVGGFGISSLVKNLGMKGITKLLVKLPHLAKVGAFSSLIGKGVEQALSEDGFNARDLALSFVNGFINGWIPIPKIGPKRLGDVLSSVAGSAISSATGIYIGDKTKEAKEKFQENVKEIKEGFFKKVEETKTKFSEKVEETKVRVNEFIEKAKKHGERFWKGLIRWLLSFDPNDIIGPTGFGDSRFIRLYEKMSYKIRFENAENATAPAQRVFIKIKLDSDFDLRTFRLGNYGFGDYTADVDEPKSFLQEKVRLVEPHNIYLRIQSGLDIVKGEASWTFQTIDPETGLSPVDPRRGFLPPNNGTSGQGYVIFTIYPKENLKSLTRIDAKAVIYFDQNEPIETPPIFNTIDSSSPKVKISLLNETSETGTPLISFHKTDIGSGVRNVDLYIANASGSNQWTPLMEDVTENVVFVPLKQGTSHEILVVGEDNVGNRDDSGTNIQMIYLPHLIHSCISVNNCSGFGSCTGLNLCQCVSGHYGSDCSETTPPVEPPIIEFEPYYNTSGNEAVLMLVNSRLVSPLIGTSLTVVFSNLPKGFSFNKGRANGKGEAAFDSKDLANLTLIPPPNFSGSLNLTVTALAIRGERRANRSGVLFMYFQGLESQIPLLETKDHCLNVTEDQEKIPLTSLIVVSGDYDETLYQLRITQLPEDFKITLDTLTKTESSWFASQNSTITIPTKSIQFADVYTPRVDNDFEPVNCSVYLVRLPYGDVIASGKFVIGLCFTVTDNDEPDAKNSKKYMVIGVSIAAGVLFIGLLFLLIRHCRNKCNSVSRNPGTSAETNAEFNMEVLPKH